MYSPSVSSAVEVNPDHNLLVSCYSNVQPVINHDNTMFPNIFAIKQVGGFMQNARLNGNI